MGFMKPDVPGPSAEEIELQKQQKAALDEEQRQRDLAEAKERKRRRDIRAGRIGLRSLLSGGFGGFTGNKLGG